jgi:hypothetical protein
MFTVRCLAYSGHEQSPGESDPMSRVTLAYHLQLGEGRKHPTDIVRRIVQRL